MMRVRLHPAVHEDLFEIMDYYNGRKHACVGFLRRVSSVREDRWDATSNVRCWKTWLEAV